MLESSASMCASKGGKEEWFTSVMKFWYLLEGIGVGNGVGFN